MTNAPPKLVPVALNFTLGDAPTFCFPTSELWRCF